MVATRSSAKDRAHMGTPEVRGRTGRLHREGVRHSAESRVARRTPSSTDQRMSAPVGRTVTHAVSCILDGVTTLSEDQAQALLERCPDAVGVSESDWVVTASFERRALTFSAAVASVLADLTALGHRVARLETEDILGIPEIAERLGRTRESVRLLVAGRRGPGGFPQSLYPDMRKSIHVWSLPAVERWFAAYEGRPLNLDVHADEIAAINAALALARLRTHLAPSARRLVDKLAAA